MVVSTMFTVHGKNECELANGVLLHSLLLHGGTTTLLFHTIALHEAHTVQQQSLECPPGAGREGRGG